MRRLPSRRGRGRSSPPRFATITRRPAASDSVSVVMAIICFIFQSFDGGVRRAIARRSQPRAVAESSWQSARGRSKKHGQICACISRGSCFEDSATMRGNCAPEHWPASCAASVTLQAAAVAWTTLRGAPGVRHGAQEGGRSRHGSPSADNRRAAQCAALPARVGCLRAVMVLHGVSTRLRWRRSVRLTNA